MNNRHKLQRVWATTFDDETFSTGPGWKPGVIAAAMPHTEARNKKVKVTYPKTGKSLIIPVLDVGPYMWIDSSYVLNGKRPKVEYHREMNAPLPDRDGYSKSFRGKVPASAAGIDLTPDAWILLGVNKTYEQLKTHSAYVDIEWFIEEEPEAPVEEPERKVKKMGFGSSFRKTWKEIFQPVEKVAKGLFFDYLRARLMKIPFRGGHYEVEVPEVAAQRIEELEKDVSGLRSKYEDAKEELENKQHLIEQVQAYLQHKGKVQEFLSYIEGQ